MTVRLHTGIRLASGQHLAADVVVTATGFKDAFTQFAQGGIWAWLTTCRRRSPEGGSEYPQSVQRVRLIVSAPGHTAYPI